MYFEYPFPATSCFDPVAHAQARVAVDFVQLPGGLVATVRAIRPLPGNKVSQYVLNVHSQYYRSSSSACFSKDQILWFLKALAHLKPPCQEPEFSTIKMAMKLFPHIDVNALTSEHWHTVSEHRRAWITEIYEPAIRARQDAILAILRVFPMSL